MVEAHPALARLGKPRLGIPGVTKSYAIQAGRELQDGRGDQVSDDQADQLSFDISQRIMNEMTYPGQVKITVIRERRGKHRPLMTEEGRTPSWGASLSWQSLNVLLQVILQLVHPHFHSS